jgi:hypothetical protein
MLTRRLEVISISICVARKSIENGTEARIGEVKFATV